MYVVEQSLTFPFLSPAEFAAALEGSIQKDRWPPILLAIETTGLAKDESFIFLIGAARFSPEGYQLSQWFAETPGQEKEILTAFLSWLAGKGGTLVHFNGNAFALSFLRHRCALYGLEPSFDACASLDLYRSAASLKDVLRLSHLRQTELEAFFGCQTRTGIKARACPALYQKYVGAAALAAVKTASMTEQNQENDDTHAAEKMREALCFHNLENLRGISELSCLLAYFRFRDGGYEILRVTPQQEEVVFTLSPLLPFPVPFTVKGRDCRLEGAGDTATLCCTFSTGQRLRLYHQDFASYDYLPGEDQAVPRVLSQYLDRSLKKPATLYTCYTWFTCGKAFFENPGQQRRFLDALLKVLIS